MRAALESLNQQHGVKVLRVDSGGTLNSVLLAAGLVDEVSVLIHPFLAGGEPGPTMFDPSRAGFAGLQVRLDDLADEILFVADGMTGQDAVRSAEAFLARLDFGGVVLTKMDGDARGGAALSIRAVTGRPIQFISAGEKLDALEVFHPDRMASRILGMGDVVSLVEQVHSQVDQEKAQKLAAKLTKGGGFDLTDLREQLQQFQNMGGLGAIMDKLPAGMLPAGGVGQVDERQIRRQIAIINSMTPGERRRPGTLDGSRKRRIAAGSGVQVQEVNRLLKQFTEMERMMKKLKGGGLRKLMRGLGGRLPGGLPGGFPRPR